jgi:single-strand DNA-binding protein
MNNLNSVLLEGIMIKDPELKSSPKGVSICTFTIGSNRYFKDDSGVVKEESLFEVKAYGKLAESCHELGKKGRGTRVVGRLFQQRSSSPGGKLESKVIIIADHVEYRPDLVNKGPEEAAPEDLDAKEPSLFG